MIFCPQLNNTTWLKSTGTEGKTEKNLQGGPDMYLLVEEI